MKHLFKPFLFALLVMFISSCDNSDDETIDPGISKSVTVSDFNTTINENPLNGMSLGVIEAVGTGGSLHFNLIEGSGFALNESNGELTVTDSSIFDFELNASVIGAAMVGLDNEPDNEQRVEIRIDLIDLDEAPALSVQQRLNASESPFDIYQSDNSLLDSLYGKTYEGGLIFYLNTADGTGLVSAPQDQSTGIAWDTTSNFVNQVATGAISKAIGDGQTNTTTIVSTLSSLGNYAAKLCDDLELNSKNDWFLPSSDEADVMFDNLQKKGFGGFASEFYWTSTEFDLSTGAALYRNFDVSATQIGGTSPKIALYHVRAVRSF